ncbi:MAG: glutaredoxin family protein [Gammaproteobacteria bacterium]
MAELLLYVTSGCHLCEAAEVIVQQALGRAVATVEIADDDILRERYGLRIPVLRRADTGVELDWPFAAEQVQTLLRD